MRAPEGIVPNHTYIGKALINRKPVQIREKQAENALRKCSPAVRQAKHSLVTDGSFNRRVCGGCLAAVRSDRNREIRKNNVRQDNFKRFRTRIPSRNETGPAETLFLS